MRPGPHEASRLPKAALGAQCAEARGLGQGTNGEEIHPICFFVSIVIFARSVQGLFVDFISDPETGIISQPVKFFSER